LEETNENQILAASSGWVAAVLNMLPGLGTGYLYQRRWKAYWITNLISFVWITINFYIDLGVDPSDPLAGKDDSTSFIGLFIIAITTSIEATLSLKSARATTGK
tara:strand:+ start:5640 stop:5951 length:312 start_codon:yes stop_codon:yes gene_type:complete